MVGHVQEANSEDVDNAIQCALNAAPIWQATPPAERAAILERAADLMESEIFLRYYAVQARNDFTNDAHRPLGPVVCISPWNFPLAIFSGQVAAALAAGNPVLAKPAEQTPLIAAQADRRAERDDRRQVVIDVVSSAFDSAGQRCSALRVLCLQEDSADRVIEMLKGAMAESRLGNPERLSVDIGPAAR